MAGIQGKIEEVKGPFTYWVEEVAPDPEINRGKKEEHRVGPNLFLMQRDKHGNDYIFAEISPLVSPADVKEVLRKLNK